MGLTRKIIHGTMLLTGAQVVTHGLSFIRNLIMARLLTKADFGLAAALAACLSLFELVSRMAIGVQMVRAAEGEHSEYQNVAHAVQAVVGTLSALLVLAIAWPMAVVFHQPGLTWAFAAMALVPLARGFLHLDLARFQRGLEYERQVISDVVPQLLATLAAWPLAAWLRDFRAVLWIMLGKEILTLAMSHFLAERPYRFKWRIDYVKGMWAFSWPLLLNGLVMVGAQQGDQMLVGFSFSLEHLAVYSIAFALTSVPWYIFAQVGSFLMMPLLSRHQDDHEQFERYYRRSLELSTIGAAVAVGPMIVAGGPLVQLLYGPKYSGAGPLMAIFGTVVALRFFRWAPALGAMARADTVNQLVGNVVRATSLPLALLIVGAGLRSLPLVAVCGLVGEVFAIAVTVRRLRERQGLGLLLHARPFGFLVSWLTAATVIQIWIGEGASIWVSGGATIGLWVATALAGAVLLPETFALYRRAAVVSKPALLGSWRS